MFGYIIAGLIGLILVGFLIAALGKAQPRTGTRGKEHGNQPVQSNTPAADAPTPDLSVTAEARQIRAARQHTPPA